MKNWSIHNPKKILSILIIYLNKLKWLSNVFNNKYIIKTKDIKFILKALKKLKLIISSYELVMSQNEHFKSNNFSNKQKCGK